ncbi:hypothetical protein [Geothrix campi]|uniref:hypothetical protein n=1 Tax=Geothrix campi TaxID=2966450 RepID=UPI0021485FCC|nr:hypothetical protein [Geothrix sp. SG10]
MNSLSALLAILLMAPAMAQQTEPVRLADGQIRLASVQIGSSQKEVTHRFGRPIQKNPIADPMFCNSEIELKYKGIRTYFCDKSLVNLVCTVRKYATPAGARVGMESSQVIALYGHPEILSKDNQTELIYRSLTSETALVFHVENGKVNSIELWCDFT